MRYFYHNGRVVDLYLLTEAIVGDIYKFMSTDDDYIMITPDGYVILNDIPIDITIDNIDDTWKSHEIRQNDRYFTIFNTTRDPFIERSSGYVIDIPTMSVLKGYEDIFSHIFALPGDRVIIDSTIYDINTSEEIEYLVGDVFNTYGNFAYMVHHQDGSLAWVDTTKGLPMLDDVEYNDVEFDAYPHGNVMLVVIGGGDDAHVYYEGRYVNGFYDTDPSRYARIDETHIFLDDAIVNLLTGEFVTLPKATSFAAHRGYLVIKDTHGVCWIFRDFPKIGERIEEEQAIKFPGEILALHNSIILTTDGFVDFSKSETK